ncbi:MAG: MBL fold metallo-hydrolase [Bacteroidota bacterium]
MMGTNLQIVVLPSPIWKLKFYGVRGSTPVCDPFVSEFGGNTTCFYLDLLVKEGDEKVIAIFDAGTGIRQLGKDILSGDITLTPFILLHMSHFHWDHIQGFPFFGPAYIPNQKIALYSPHYNDGETDLLERVFARQMHSEYFPVQLDKMGADMRFYTTEEFQDALGLDDNVSFHYRKHNHPGGAYSYRLEGYGKSITICTDLEHGETIDEDVVDFCKNSDVLIHDGQYNDEELPTRRGWGHSSWNQAIEVAQRAGVGHLYITHHDPDHDDDFLRQAELDCRSRFTNCTFAREGDEVLI